MVQEKFGILTKDYLDFNKKEIKKLIRRYLKDSYLSQDKFLSVISAMENSVLTNPNFHTFIYDRGLGPEGYVLVQKLDNRIFVWNLKLPKDVFKDFESVLLEFGKALGCSELMFHSKRGKDFYGMDWEVGPTIFTKKVSLIYGDQTRKIKDL